MKTTSKKKQNYELNTWKQLMNKAKKKSVSNSRAETKSWPSQITDYTYMKPDFLGCVQCS